MLGFDLETTSRNAPVARTCQYAFAHVADGKVAAVTQVVDPGREIPAQAAEIHGITTERAREEGVPLPAAIETISAALTEAAGEGVPVVIFNAPYDLTIVETECRRLEVPSPPWEELRVVDPLLIDKILDRYRKGSRKLGDTCQAYGARLDTAHDALSDAVAACRMAWVLAEKGYVKRKYHDEEYHAVKEVWEAAKHDLDALHLAQVRWAEQEAVRFQAYLEEQGSKRQIDTAWPVLPWEDAVRQGREAAARLRENALECLSEALMLEEVYG
jgi:DNA polymerase-3 subunit epsilon